MRMNISEVVNKFMETVIGMDIAKIPNNGKVGTIQTKLGDRDLYNTKSGNFFMERDVLPEDGKRQIVKLNKVFPKDITVSFAKHPFHLIAHADHFDIAVNAPIMVDVITGIVGHKPRQGLFRLDLVTTMKTMHALVGKLDEVNEKWVEKEEARKLEKLAK